MSVRGLNKFLFRRGSFIPFTIMDFNIKDTVP